MAGVAIGLQRRDQLAKTGRQDNQVSSIGAGRVRVRDTSGNEDRRSCAGDFAAIEVSERQLTCENVPPLIVRMVDVQLRRPATSPFVNLK